MVTLFSVERIKRWVVFLLLAGLVATVGGTSALAGWNPLKKPFAPITDSANKIGKYISKQTGNQKVQENINGASTEAKKTAQQAQETIKELSPVVKGAAESVKQTSEGVADLLQFVKWPLFVLMIAAAVWMSGKAIAVWRASPFAAKAVLVIGLAALLGAKFVMSES